MAEENPSSGDADSADPGGLVGSIRKLASTIVGIFQTRLEILATEINEARLRSGQLLLLLAVVIFCLGISVVLLAVFVVVLFWDTHRLVALGIMTGSFLGVSLVGLLLIRGKVASSSKMFAVTLAELAKDRERLK